MKLTENPYERERAFEEIAGAIKELIIRGELKPGDRMPTETAIAKQFNVGRNTIREALRILELSGFVRIQRGGKGGPLIIDTSLNRITNLSLDLIRLQRLSPAEVKLARCETEKMVLQEALKVIDEQDIAALAANIRVAEDKVRDGVVALDENLNFHKLLAKASKNYLYVIESEIVLTAYSHYRTTSTRMNVTSSKFAIDAHKKILAAIVAGNRELALTELENELSTISDWLKEPPNLRKTPGRRSAPAASDTQPKEEGA